MVYCSDTRIYCCKKKMTRNRTVERYKALHPTLEGWFLWEAAELLNFLNDIQLKEHTTGDIFEISAYKGKLTLLLATFLRKENELLFVNDIFDNQHLNISRSGIDANLNDFMNNMKLLFDNPHFLRLLIKSSSELTIEDTTNNIRMFSVDGGHSEKETYDDMLVAAKAINDKGMIIVDDFYNGNWPDVQKGVAKYFEEYNDLAPLVYFYNKFIFIKKSALEYYREILEKHGLVHFCAEKHFRLATQAIYHFEFLSIA
jgi:hypothetical protein